MKLLWMVVAFSLGAGGVNLLKNGDFEKFVGGEPVGWTTNNIPSMLVIVSSSSLSASGKSAVRYDVKKFYETNMAGMINQKKYPCWGKGDSAQRVVPFHTERQRCRFHQHRR
ncbi:MAG: hypothetical protein C4326_05150 [Ignavibacteria bacterium]